MSKTAAGLFGVVEPYAGDPILSLFEAFQKDPRPDKINLGIGVYTDENGDIPVLAAVSAARERLSFGPRPYLPMEGLGRYRQAVQELVFGADHPALAEQRIATIQTVGGTGAVAIAADVLARHCPGRDVFISDPSWENHHGLFQRAGFRTRTYPWWDLQNRSISMDRLLATLAAAPTGSIIVIQPVCHNPTGLDLSPAEQQSVTDCLIERRHIAMFDMAYQGFGDGLDEDAAFVRRYAEHASCLVASSFSKNMSLYGERCGGLSIVCRDADEAARALGQLKLAVRRSYSSPPLSGGEIVAEVLTTPDLRALCEAELGAMRARMRAGRRALADALSAAAGGIDTHFLVEQRGMFSYSGLSSGQVRQLRDEHAIYLLDNGRMCVAGITRHNVARIARGITAALGWN